MANKPSTRKSYNQLLNCPCVRNMSGPTRDQELRVRRRADELQAIMSTMEGQYAGWQTGQQSTPMIPAIKLLLDERSNASEACTDYDEAELSELNGRRFEEKWYSSLNSAAEAFKASRGAYPFLALYNPRYDKVAAAGSTALKDQIALQHLIHWLFPREPTGDSMVDFVIFICGDPNPNAISETDAIVLLEVKAKRRRAGTARKKAYGQINRTSQFLKQMMRYVTGGEDATGFIKCKICPVISLDNAHVDAPAIHECDGHIVANTGNACCGEQPEKLIEWLRSTVDGCPDVYSCDASATKGTQVPSVATNSFRHLIALIAGSQQNITLGGCIAYIRKQRFLGALYDKDIVDLATEIFGSEDIFKGSKSNKRRVAIAEDKLKELLDTQPESGIEAILTKRAIKSHLLGLDGGDNATFFFSQAQAQIVMSQELLVWLTGPPGTGKTLMLQARAIAMFKRPHYVLCVVGSNEGLQRLYRNFFCTQQFKCQEQYCLASSGARCIVMRKCKDDATCIVIVPSAWRKPGGETAGRCELYNEIDVFAQFVCQEKHKHGLDILVDDALPSSYDSILSLRETLEASSLWLCGSIRDATTAGWPDPKAGFSRLNVNAVYRYSVELFQHFKDTLRHPEFVDPRLAVCAHDVGILKTVPRHERFAVCAHDVGIMKTVLHHEGLAVCAHDVSIMKTVPHHERLNDVPLQMKTVRCAPANARETYLEEAKQMLSNPDNHWQTDSLIKKFVDDACDKHKGRLQDNDVNACRFRLQRSASADAAEAKFKSPASPTTAKRRKILDDKRMERLDGYDYRRLAILAEFANEATGELTNKAVGVVNELVRLRTGNVEPKRVGQSGNRITSDTFDNALSAEFVAVIAITGSCPQVCAKTDMKHFERSSIIPTRALTRYWCINITFLVAAEPKIASVEISDGVP